MVRLMVLGAVGIPWWSPIHVGLYTSHQLVCVQVCLCVCILLCPVLIIAARLGNEVIFTSHHR